MRVLYLDPITFPPAALDDATMLQLRRYLLGSSIVPISSCFFVDAFTLTTEQVRRELATCANRWLFLDPSGDSVTVSAVPGESVFVDGNILRDGEKRTLVHGSRITLATTASFEISYDFYETPRAATRSPVDSTRTRPDVVLDTQAGDVDVEPKEEPAISDVPMPLPESLQLQAPTTLAPVAIVTPTIAAPQDGTAPAVPKCVAAPATKRAVPLARDVSLLQTSATLAFQNTRLPDPAPWPDELPDLFDGGNDHDHDDQQDAPVAENPPRSHRGLGPSFPVTARERRVPQTLSVPKQRPTVDAPAPPRRRPTQNDRSVVSRTPSVDPPTSPPRRRTAPRIATTRSASTLEPPTSPPARTRLRLARRASTPAPKSPPIPFLCTEKRCHKIATFENAERKWKCDAHRPRPTPHTPQPTTFTILESVIV